MNNLKGYLLGLALICGSSWILYGQNTEIHELCGSDSIKISLDNYQYGKVEWQESKDGIHWLSIKNEHDTVLIYHTSEEKYIRGYITCAECEPFYSNPAFIRQKPIAYAGMDKDVMTEGIYLRGNTVEGSTGRWEILSGSGGELSEPENPLCFMSSIDTSTFLLSWTLSNKVCGASSDTIKISFIQNEYNPNRILVDQTDIIHYDSSDIHAGVYYIQFSEVFPIPDSALLIGYTGDGFLLKVNHYDQINESTYRFFTSPGEIEDLLIEGVLNTGDDINVEESLMKSADGTSRILTHLPTRSELLKDPKFKEGVYVYYLPDEKSSSAMVKSSKNREGGGVEIDLGSHTVELEFSDEFKLEVGLEGSILFDPNFVFDYRVKCGFPHKWWKFECGLNYLKSGMENALLENTLKVNMKSNFEWSEELVKKSAKKELYKKRSAKVVIAGTVPILVMNTLSIEFKIEPKLEASIDVSYTWTKSSSFSAYLLYKRGKFLKPVCEKGPSSTSTSFEVVVEGSAGVDFILTPKVDMKLYGTVGPYLKIPLSLKPEVCYGFRPVGADIDQHTWGFNVPLSIDAELGCEMKIFRKMLFNTHVSTNIYKAGFFNPNSLNLISGNHQIASPNQEMEKPFKVQVKNNWGGGSPLLPVYFSVVKGDGYFEDPMAMSDMDGFAKNYLTLGESSYNKIQVEAFHCDFSPLDNADELFFEVNSKCKNSGLQLSFNYLADRSIQALGVMGARPYEYSLNNNNDFQSTPITMDLAEAIEQKTFYVKDAHECVASNYIEAIDSCNFSSLSVSVKLTATSTIAEASSGTPPYEYAMDSSLNFSLDNKFDYLNIGNHQVIVRDHSGCTASQDFNIHIESTDSLVAFYPLNGSANDESGNLHHGIADTVVPYTDRFGKENSACAFDYNSKRIRVPAHDGFIMEGDFSITLWSFHYNTGGTVLSIGKDEFDPGGLHFAHTESCKMDLYTDREEAEICSQVSMGSVEYPEWHMVSIIRKADSIVLYLDEKHIGSMHKAGELFRSCDLYFGGKHDNSELLEGGIDDIRLFSRALRENEISALYHDNGWDDGLLNDPFVDPRDGIAYRQVRIGEQVWMTENLKWLPEVSPPIMYDYTAPQYFVYGYEGSDVEEAREDPHYLRTGVLYNERAAWDACPAGWKIPTNGDWESMKSYVTGQIPDKEAGEILKAGVGWIQNNGSDDFRFSATPGGALVTFPYPGGFEPRFDVEEYGVWYEFDDGPEPELYQRIMKHENQDFDKYEGQSGGFTGQAVSIRCIKEIPN